MLFTLRPGLPPFGSSAILRIPMVVLMLAGCAGAPRSPTITTTSPLSAAALASAETTEYVDGPATIDGIGKYYMGREISHVMGHLAAGWLERETRESEERTDLLIEFLLEQDARTYADIGVGTGFFALPLAQAVPTGRVLGVDIQREMLAMLSQRATQAGIENVEPVLGRVDDPNLPEGEVDLVLIVDAYHEFSHPREMIAGIVRGLRPGGRLVLVEYRGEDVFLPIKELHKMTEEQSITEMSVAGLEWVQTADFLPQQHVLVFEKPMGGSRN